MSPDSLCRLCLYPLHENFKELIDSNGQCSEAYEIVSKYFDPMLLIASEEQFKPILCSICWQHIQDFYNFQQNVFKAHSKLQDVNEIAIVFKQEEEEAEQVEEVVKQTAEESSGVLLNEEKYFSSKGEKPLIAIRKANKQKSTHLKSSKRVRKKRNICVKKIKSTTPSIDVITTDSNDVDNNSSSSEIKQKTLENDAFIAAWKSELECVKCKATFENFTLLRKHFHKEHFEEKCYIVCCDRKFCSRYHIVEHIRLHMDPNAYRCNICGRCSTNARNLAKHIKELHSEEGKNRCLVCPICLKNLANKNSLKVHMETHNTDSNFVCRECGKGFPSQQKRTLHERYVHNAALICDQCGKTLHNRYAMSQHLLQHAGVQKRKWPCDLCTAELNSHSGLKRHKLLIHQDGTTVYVCSDCGKVASNEIALMTHKKNVHLSERKHKCTLCDKSFKFPRVLREHMATHTGEDLYKCPYCERTFKTNANMHHHRKKIHPLEWAEARLNKPQITKVDFNIVQNEIVI